MPDTALVHLLGFVTGGSLYALLAVMIARSSRSPAGLGGSRLALATALLGLVWNAGALVVYALRDFGVDAPLVGLSATAFAALGFLPAVVVHAALQGLRGPVARSLVGAAYLLSTAAAAAHGLAALQGTAIPSRAALLALTIGYVLLTGAVATQHQRVGGGRALSAVALAVFAVSAFHLGVHAEEGESWVVALLGHHASVPLALVILYQDYRFALADVFLKRALSLVALVALAGTLWSFVGDPLLARLLDGDDPRAVVVLLGLWVLTALLYPPLHRAMALFVDRVVLRRPDYARVRAEVGLALERAASAEGALLAAQEGLVRALGATSVRVVAIGSAGDEPALRLAATSRDARVHVPTADPPSYVLEVGELAGGRRLLSDDSALLDAVALLVGRRIDAVRVTHERYERDVREEEMRRLASEAELGALRAQLNPHFLFNALNTLGWLMRAAPDRAQDVLQHLTGLLRAVLHRSSRELCTLSEELDLVRAYLGIESARFEERLRVRIEVPDALLELRVPPLVLQPLVENAVKHGIAPAREGGTVTVRGALVDADGGAALLLEVHDSGIGATAARLGGRAGGAGGAGVGLANLERRLDRYFGSRGSLVVEPGGDGGTIARVTVPASGALATAARTTAARDVPAPDDRAAGPAAPPRRAGAP